MTSTPKRDLMALSRAREKAALDWYARTRSAEAIGMALQIFDSWQDLKEAIKEAYAKTQGFATWNDFCANDK